MDGFFGCYICIRVLKDIFHRSVLRYFSEVENYIAEYLKVNVSNKNAVLSVTYNLD